MSATSEQRERQLKRLLVWWISDKEREWLSAQPCRRGFGVLDDCRGYFVSELHESYGRAGRGRLWVSPGFSDIFGDICCMNVPKIAESCAGFVIARSDWGMVTTVGFVTDLDGKLLTERDRVRETQAIADSGAA